MHAHGGLLVVLLSLALGALVGNFLVAAGAAGWGRSRLARLPVAQLHRMTWAGLLLPGGFSLLFTGAVVAVPAVALFAPTLDHCAAYPAAPHLCFTHGTLAFSSGWEAAVAVAIGALALAALSNELRRFLHARRSVVALFGGGARGAYVQTDDDMPYAFSLGIVAPRIVISRGLKTILSKAQLRAAVAHEVAHVRGRDAMWRVVARLASFLLWPSLRRQLVSLLVLAQEKRADRRAAITVGSAALVAETLLVLGRQHPGKAAPNLAPAFSSGWLEARVEALCLPQHGDRLVYRSVLTAAVLSLPVLLAPVQLHSVVESLAGVMVASPVHGHHAAGHVDLGELRQPHPED